MSDQPEQDTPRPGQSDVKLPTPPARAAMGSGRSPRRILAAGRAMIAALFVERGGCYYGLSDVDPWPQERDARLYAGPWPVIAHPPCERWGRYWGGSPTTWPRKIKGDDDGCFAAALASVRRWGGVLEHPEGSAAWPALGLIAPPRNVLR